MIPYGRQTIDEDDIRAVVEALRSDWLTTGPRVAEFEQVLAAYVGAREAVAVSSGTAALHCAMDALGIGQGDEVIVPAITFAATANCVLYQGGTPVFADVDPGTLLMDPASVESRITERTRAVIAVDFAGQPCDYERLRDIASRRKLILVADGCHALGAEYAGEKVGNLAEMTIFSFHPVKHITTGEGGMVTTNSPELARRIRQFRNHGISLDFRQRQEKGTWNYDMVSLGFNYRLTDIQCALGRSQLTRLDEFLAGRRRIAALYDRAFEDFGGITPLAVRPAVRHAYHLYVVRVSRQTAGLSRDALYQELVARGIGVNVHYKPVYLHAYYRDRLGFEPGLCPVAEEAYDEILSLPMFPAMTTDDVHSVIETIREIVLKAARNKC